MLKGVASEFGGSVMKAVARQIFLVTKPLHVDRLSLPQAMGVSQCAGHGISSEASSSLSLVLTLSIAPAAFPSFY